MTLTILLGNSGCVSFSQVRAMKFSKVGGVPRLRWSLHHGGTGFWHGVRCP